MKNKDDKEIERLVGKMMAESPLESPSVNFTTNIMSAVLSTEPQRALVYKPVISKRAWFVIFGVIILLFAFLIFNTEATSSTYNFDFTAINFNKYFAPFSAIKMSSMTVTVLLAATIMLFIQIFLLKNYLDKRFQK